MADRKPPQGGAAKPGADQYHVVLHARDEKAVAPLLKDHSLDVGLMRRHRDSGQVDLVLFLAERDIERLRAAGFDLDVRENLSAVGRERQKEVGKGDRFADGKVAPTGLGKKTPRR